jgi:hypothetical protein
MSTTSHYYCPSTIRTDSDIIEQMVNDVRNDLLEFLESRDLTRLIVDCKEFLVVRSDCKRTYFWDK